MKSKVFKLAVLCFMCVVFFSMPVFASEEDDPDALIPITVESKLLPPDVKFCRVVIPNGDFRGNYFSNMIIEILNPEPGVVGISAGVVCSEKVDRIYLKVYLDVKKSSGWSQVKSWTYNEYNAVINTQYEEYTGAKAGEYYRLRASYTVYMGEDRESGSSNTDALQVD